MSHSSCISPPCRPLLLLLLLLLQDAGFDVQTMGFGKLAAYHANNEYALLSDFKKGFQILVTLLDEYHNAS
jgi:acetylornithine deacetylase